MQKILPSAHLYEVFMPIAEDEKRMTEVLEEIAELGFYKGIELGMFFQPEYRKRVRRLVEDKQYQLTQWAAPYLMRRGLNLSSLDPALRKISVAYTVELVRLAAETGATNFGLPSGDYPGDNKREQAKEALFDSYCAIHEEVAKHAGMRIILEPLDRYAYKKQLMGPMPEVVEWIKALRQANPHIYIHWDSAHEVLGEIDLIKSLNLARPYLAQLHLCNCIADKSHPCYGDLHMDVGAPPDYRTWGYLTPEVGAGLLREVASFDTAPGVKNTYCALEVRSHPGDDLWAKERMIRTFLKRTFELAGMEY